MKKFLAVLISVCFISSSGFSAPRGQRNLTDNTQSQPANRRVNAKPFIKQTLPPSPAAQNKTNTAARKESAARFQNRNRIIINRSQKNEPAKSIAAQSRPAANNLKKQNPRINGNIKTARPQQQRRDPFLKDNPKRNAANQRPQKTIVNSANSKYHNNTPVSAKPERIRSHNRHHGKPFRRHRTSYNPFVYIGIFSGLSTISAIANYRRYFYRTHRRHYFYRRPFINLTFYNYSDPYWTYYDSVYYAEAERIVEAEKHTGETAVQESAVSETAHLSDVTVLNAAFYRVFSTAAPSVPTAEVTVLNNSDYAVSEIYFRGQLETRETGKVLIDDAFNYELPQYLMPGQSAVYKIPLSSFDKWTKVKPPDTAVFSVVITGITADSGESVRNK
ncbi:MAG: hypothetical protein LBR69_06940 [Endomicrobium sp.]|jgi:hypothetical protein|nr:hypothetical protein [Endomicrobium sp.]